MPDYARLLKRVFEIDLEHYPQCGGELKIIAAIEEPAVTACGAGDRVADGEKGYLNFLFAPAGTPQSVLETLNREVGLITSDIQFRDTMRQRTFALRTYSLQVMHDVTVKQRLMNESLIKKARIKLE